MPIRVRDVLMRPIEADAFRAFGDIIQPGSSGRSVNLGAALRHDRVADLVQSRAGAKPNLALFEVAKARFPARITWLERHVCSTQVFVPMDAGRYVATVAKVDVAVVGDASLEGLRAFLVSSGTGISYRPGVWHHGLLPLDGDMRFAMLVWEDGSEADCEIVEPARAISVTTGLLV